MTDRDPFYANLLEWLTGDNEIRSLEIDVRASDVDYVGGDTDDHAVWTYYYEIKAHDVDVYGADGIDGMVAVSFHGSGADLDEAAEHVLAAIHSHKVFSEKTRLAGITWED